MVRKPSTDQNGNPFSNEMRQKVADDKDNREERNSDTK